MAEIKQFKPSTKERPKPEEPADMVDIESARRKKPQEKPEEVEEASSVLSDAIDFVRQGQYSDAEIDELRTLSDSEKSLLKVVSALFERLKEQDKEIEELRALIRHLQENKV